MSIIIKGMDMPKEEINITITKDGRIYLDNKYHMIAEAIQIPKGHGRLIDENKVAQIVLNLPSGEYWSDNAILSMLDDAPTILEAEE